MRFGVCSTSALPWECCEEAVFRKHGQHAARASMRPCRGLAGPGESGSLSYEAAEGPGCAGSGGLGVISGRSGQFPVRPECGPRASSTVLCVAIISFITTLECPQSEKQSDYSEVSACYLFRFGVCSSLLIDESNQTKYKQPDTCKKGDDRGHPRLRIFGVTLVVQESVLMAQEESKR